MSKEPLQDLEIECTNNTYLILEDRINPLSSNNTVLELYLGITDKDLLGNDKKYDWPDGLKALLTKDGLEQLVKYGNEILERYNTVKDIK